MMGMSDNPWFHSATVIYEAHIMTETQRASNEAPSLENCTLATQKEY